MIYIKIVYYLLSYLMIQVYKCTCLTYLNYLHLKKPLKNCLFTETQLIIKYAALFLIIIKLIYGKKLSLAGQLAIPAPFFNSNLFR